ncbi:MAG TPA: UDP-2,3-diacylglucosamine diphosphatase [Candidatus Eisenbacteria bacterium]|nr:UDP-2,3-diacylglucosamine diphosphatase [Candidatus Eisenbacteria bacterium]
MRPAAVYFVSDAHLGAEPPDRERAREARLHDFLNSLPGRAAALYVVGDLFDFWFEYRSAIPRRHFPTLAALKRVRDAGVDVVYLNGNHDFWLGPFLSEVVGARTVDGAVALSQQGRRLWIHHGDGLVGGDLGYRLLRRILRNRVSVRLYQGLHPDVGLPVARFVSSLSRAARGQPPLQPERLWREIAEPRFREGFDAVIVGHFHHVYERREPGRELFVLGDWIERFTYLVLENGRLELKTWPQPA